MNNSETLFFYTIQDNKETPCPDSPPWQSYNRHPQPHMGVRPVDKPQYWTYRNIMTGNNMKPVQETLQSF